MLNFYIKKGSLYDYEPFFFKSKPAFGKFLPKKLSIYVFFIKKMTFKNRFVKENFIKKKYIK